jgi:hypothetical protein
VGQTGVPAFLGAVSGNVSASTDDPVEAFRCSSIGWAFDMPAEVIAGR